MLQFTFPKEKPKSNQKFLKLGKFVQIHNFFLYTVGRVGAIAETEKKKFVFAPDPELT